MIARIFIIIIILIILPDIYIDAHYLRHKSKYSWWKRLLWWTPGTAMILYTLKLTFEKDFVPTNMSVINIYLFLLGLLVAPKLLFMIFSFVGWQICRWKHKRLNIGNIIGFICAIITIIMLVYGSTFGVKNLNVSHIDYYSENLPEAFEGYRIIHFTDVHSGSFTGNDTTLLRSFIDSINAQHGDMIVFTGDLQNKLSSELYPLKNIFSRLHAHDGVISILGNHDYSEYISATDEMKRKNENEHIRMHKEFGWQLLLNDNIKIHRGADSIVIVGTENDGRAPFPKKADYKKAMHDIDDNDFIVMLQHDPSAWERNILPNTKSHLTLSGHTHGGQFKMFGWSPASFAYHQWGGYYEKEGRGIYVSTGIGGVVPFRIGMSPEIAVITLHKKQ